MIHEIACYIDATRDFWDCVWLLISCSSYLFIIFIHLYANHRENKDFITHASRFISQAEQETFIRTLELLWIQELCRYFQRIIKFDDFEGFSFFFLLRVDGNRQKSLSKVVISVALFDTRNNWQAKDNQGLGNFMWNFGRFVHLVNNLSSEDEFLNKKEIDDMLKKCSRKS